MNEISVLKSAGKKKHVNKTPNLVRQLQLFLDKNELVHCRGCIHNAPLVPLLKDRLRDTTPLMITEVDFTGTLYVNDNIEQSKVYIYVFIYMVQY